MVEHTAERLTSIFHALADATRREMLARLSQEAMTVTSLAAPFDMSLAAASKHIRVLERAGLISRRVAGRVHLCSLDALALREADEWLRHYERFWSERLDVLERALRKPESRARPEGLGKPEALRKPEPRGASEGRGKPQPRKSRRTQ
jgi:DNA-binding transcriptional ArsR family regulator